MSGNVAAVTYALLTVLWGTILVLYLRQRREARRRDALMAVLLSVLALDAAKSVVESVYFGVLWAAQYGVLGAPFHVLGRPGPLTAIKWLNLGVALVVLVTLVRTWIPSRLRQREADRTRRDDLVQQARESEERLRAAFQTIPDAIGITRVEDRVIVAVNDGFVRLTGWSEEEAAGKTSVALGLWVDPGGRPQMSMDPPVGHAVQEAEASLRRKDGSAFTAVLRASVFTVAGKQYVLNVIRDVTEARTSERARAAIYRVARSAGDSATLLQLLETVHQVVGELMAAPNLYIAVWDAEADKLDFPYYVDQKDEAPQGPQPLGSGLTEHVLRTGKPLVLNGHADFERVTRTGEVELIGAEPTSWIGVPLKTQRRTVGVLAAQIYDGSPGYQDRDAELLQFVSTQIALAIEKKQGEEALLRSERRFRALIESTSDGIGLLAADGTLLYASPAVRQLFGPRAAVPRAKLPDLFDDEDARAIRATLEEALAKPSVPLIAQGQFRRDDGGAAVVEGVFTNLIGEPAVGGVVVNLRDRTERKQLEARLLLADRMVSVGTLAAGVAHEINNPLAYVIANLDFALAELPPGDAKGVVEALEEARSGAERVRVIVRDMKTFSRADDKGVGACDLNAVLDASANMAAKEIRHRARLVRNYAADLPDVLGNEARLGQVFLNLMINAAQAIPEGAPDANEIRVTTRAEGARLVVEVEDTGVGIPRDVLPRLFDPFFTTKPIGEGTGLGLFICQNIVSSLGGEITVESEPGKRTTVRIALPIAPSSSAGAPQQAPLVGRGVSAKILIIDDEPLVCTALRRQLPEHEVITETSAANAMWRIRGGERFDLVLCDLMMRDLSGMEFFRRLEQQDPELSRRVVFMSGGAFTPAARSFLEQVPNPRLEKPLDLDKVRALLDGAGPPRVQAG